MNLWKIDLKSFGPASVLQESHEKVNYSSFNCKGWCWMVSCITFCKGKLLVSLYKR